MLKSILGDKRDAYILVKVTKSARSTTGADDDANKENIKVIFKNCAPLIEWIDEISNTQVDCGKDLDVVIQIQKSTEYGNNYLKLSESLWQ